jgi:hypothetical protein
MIRTAIDLDQRFLSNSAANAAVARAQSANAVNVVYTWERFQRIHTRRTLDILRDGLAFSEEIAPREEGRTPHQSGKAKKFSSGYVSHVFLI